MKINQFGMLVVILTFLATTPATAVTLSLAPPITKVHLGVPLSIDIVVSELGDGIASVGAFDFDITYDDTILSATGVNCGLLLGDRLNFEADGGFDLSTPGVVDIFEVSLLSATDLDNLQPSSLTFATLTFNTIGLGISELDFTQVILDDSFGQLLNPAIQGARVTVVPVPQALWLLGSGLIGLSSLRHRKNKGKAIIYT